MDRPPLHKLSQILEYQLLSEAIEQLPEPKRDEMRAILERMAEHCTETCPIEEQLQLALEKSRKSEEESAWNARIEAADNLIAKTAMQCDRVEEVAQVALEQILELTDSRDGMISLIHGETFDALAAYYDGKLTVPRFDDEHALLEICLNGIFKEVVMAEHSGYWNNIDAEKASELGIPLNHPVPISSLLIMPLSSGDTVIGFVTVVNKEQGYDESDIQVLEKLADTITLAIELKQAQINDPKTGLFNEVGFERLADHFIEGARRQNKKITLISLDLKYFKVVNDTKGHQIGDEAMKQMAIILQKCFRKADIIARLHGDEFVIMMVDDNELTDEEIHDRLYEECNAFNVENVRNPDMSRRYLLMCSEGVHRFDPAKGETDQKSLLRQADRKMTKKKERKTRLDRVFYAIHYSRALLRGVFKE